LDKLKTHALVDCGHIFCEDCAENFINKECPFCRKTVKSKLRLFM